MNVIQLIKCKMGVCTLHRGLNKVFFIFIFSIFLHYLNKKVRLSVCLSVCLSVYLKLLLCFLPVHIFARKRANSRW